MSKQVRKNKEEEPEVDENPTQEGKQGCQTSGNQQTERPEGDPDSEPLREDEW